MPHDALDAGPGRVAPDTAKRINGRITTLSVSVAGVLVVAKAVAWWMSDSVAMLASLADSALDLGASLIAFVAVQFSSRQF